MGVDEWDAVSLVSMIGKWDAWGAVAKGCSECNEAVLEGGSPPFGTGGYN